MNILQNHNLEFFDPLDTFHLADHSVLGLLGSLMEPAPIASELFDVFELLFLSVISPTRLTLGLISSRKTTRSFLIYRAQYEHGVEFIKSHHILQISIYSSFYYYQQDLTKLYEMQEVQIFM